MGSVCRHRASEEVTCPVAICVLGRPQRDGFEWSLGAWLLDVITPVSFPGGVGLFPLFGVIFFAFGIRENSIWLWVSMKSLYGVK